MDRMYNCFDTGKITIGVVGLGLMGSSITVALLLSGHTVVGIAPLAGEDKKASIHIKELIRICAKDGLLAYPEEVYLNELTIFNDYQELDDCDIVLECVTEQIQIKKEVYKKITDFVRADTIIASNTSAIPISKLQQYVSYPDRFIGIHWAEPAFSTRFLEIIPGENTSKHVAEYIYELAHLWSKEPTLLKKDIKGFITNRLMYAVCREALSIVENKEATIDDVDKSFRHDAGSWITLMGVFRRIDFLGIEECSVIFKNTFSKLSNNEDIPSFMQRLIDLKAKGTQSGCGLYHYSEEDAKKWDEAFADFNKDIYQLALSYQANLIEKIAE